MAAIPLDYRSPRRAEPRRFWWIVCTTAGIALLVLILVPVGRERVTNWMDAGTGTMRWETKRFGKVTNQRLDVSPLEKRLATLNALPPRDWRFIHARESGGISCGVAPPIYQLMPLSRDAATKLTDAELLALVTTLQTGTEEQQKQAVDAAADKIIAR